MQPRQLGFQQTTSILERLTWLIVIVAVAFLFQSIAVLVSSSRFLRGLTEVNVSNRIFEFSHTADESLGTASEVLERIGRGEAPQQMRSVFEAGYQQASMRLGQALEQVPRDSETGRELSKAQTALLLFHAAASGALIAAAAGRTEDAQNQLLIAAQYRIEIQEGLRRIQLVLKERSDSAFEAVYRQRHMPVIVALSLAFAFFALVLTVGLTTTRRLRKSVDSLTEATEEVTRGHLEYQAPILERDEIGRLTSAFNDMVRRLAISQDRMTRLQSVTAAFSEALSREEVGEVVMRQGLNAMGASAGAVVLASADGTSLEIVRSEGYARQVVDKWSRFPIDSNVYSAVAFREQRPVFAEKAEGAADLAVTRSLAAMPLISGGKVLGSMVLSFAKERVFSEDDRHFMLALARQCAQALGRAELYDESQAAVKVRDEFLSIASHELKTPLTPLKIHLQGLSRVISQGRLESTPQERLDRMISTANSQVDRLVKLVEELLDVTRIASGNLSIDLQRLDLSELVSEVVEHFSGELLKVGCTPSIQVEPGLMILADRLRIEQVLLNLLTNAARYGAGNPVDIRTRRGLRGQAVLQVSDRGMGIAVEDQKRIFERFERASPAKNFGGLGLGLYIAQQIVAQHSGHILVESKPGEGSSFIVELPPAGMEQEPVTPPALLHRSTS